MKPDIGDGTTRKPITHRNHFGSASEANRQNNTPTQLRNLTWDEV